MQIYVYITISMQVYTSLCGEYLIYLSSTYLVNTIKNLTTDIYFILEE